MSVAWIRVDLKKRVIARPTVMPDRKHELKKRVNINPTMKPFAKFVFEYVSEVMMMLQVSRGKE